MSNIDETVTVVVTRKVNGAVNRNMKIGLGGLNIVYAI